MMQQLLLENGCGGYISQETADALVAEDVIYHDPDDHCYHMVDEAIDRMGSEEAVWKYIEETYGLEE